MNFKNQYLHNPCKTLSIPYWKHLAYKQPSNVEIIHQDMLSTTHVLKDAKRFFRMRNDLKEEYTFSEDVKLIQLSKDINQLVNMINTCYEKEVITITKQQVRSWIRRDVYDETLWVKIEKEEQIIASGIAEYDTELKEGILEWIQVLPSEQGKGYGHKIVHALLHQLKKRANFVTVSGHLDNKNNPKKLYEYCHFKGEDVWIINKQ